MGFWERKNEILGINARNLLYINRYNSEVEKDFADDKIFTKNYLQSRGIGAAKLFAVVRNYREMLNFDPASLPNNFVIKPNRGFGGEGIIPISSTKNGVYTSVSGNRYRWDDLRRECNAILEGKYAISGLHDQVIFEELLEAHPYFDEILDRGLPDIRIIVFNLVPILAMLRLPTPESGGRANLHLGALGIGLNIATGQGTHGVQRGKFVRQLPNGKSITSIQIPDWPDVLLNAAKAQQVSKIGFLAVDVSVTKAGLKVLELNARAGLSIQIANRIPLKNRLNKVKDLTVGNPEQGVEIATTIFGKPGNRLGAGKNSKPIIGLYERVEVVNTNYKDVLAKVDPHAKTSIVDQRLSDQIRGKLLDVKLGGKRMDLPFEFGDLQTHSYKLIIAGKYLKDFLIDIGNEPKSDRRSTVRTPIPETKEQKIIKNIDRKVFEIDRRLSILTYFKPLNLLEEQASFLAHKNRSPKFIYRNIGFDIEAMRKEVKRIPQRVEHPLMPLYALKINELNRKLSLLETRGTARLQHQSERLYGRVTRALYSDAVHAAKTTIVQNDSSEVLSFKKIQKTLEQFLKDNRLTHWRLNITENTAVDMATNRRGSITLRKGVEFTANRLKALIAHEIETHVFRLENGRLQPYKIFEIGTAGYAMTEEGLAVYNQHLLGVPIGDKVVWPALNVIAIYLGRKLSFAELFEYLQKNYHIDDAQAWKVCFKVKRGLFNTEEKASFTKDMIYFAGQQAVQEYVRVHGRDGLKDLYVGKIGIEDLDRVPKGVVQRPKYLPNSYALSGFKT